MRVDGLLRGVLAADPQPLAALDISPSHLRWAVLDRQAGHWCLQLSQWPMAPGWLEDGRLTDYAAVAEAVSQGLAQVGVQRLAMTVPPEACHCQVLEPPSKVWPWRRRAWLRAQALQGPFGEQSSWVAHRLDGPQAHWRLMSASAEVLQDWQGLAEAAHCQLICLEDAHQAGWRALDQWLAPPAPGACLFQVGTFCVQTLQERAGRWQWAWRTQEQCADPLERCLAHAAGSPAVFVLGEGELAARVYDGLEQAGINPITPSPKLDCQGDFTAACWPVLGLAGLRWWT